MTKWDEAKVLVTGGTRGIGYAVAGLIIESGGQAAIVGTDQGRATLAAHRLDGGQGRAHGISARIDGTEASAARLVNDAVRAMGGLTAVVNAAGGATVGHALETPWSTWQHDWNVKFWGYFAVIRAAVAHLPAGLGVVVNVLGITGKDPNPRLAAATTINGALRGLTKILADDLAPRRIRVLAVNPGATDTDLLRLMAEGYAALQNISREQALAGLKASGPLGRLPTARDIAQAVVFLLSEEARMITGTSIDIDGGSHRGPA